MILIDRPYVSDLLKENIRDSGLPLIRTEAATTFSWALGTPTISEEEAIDHFQKNPTSPIYASSENALDWVSRQLPFSRLPEFIELFKDKALFRERLKPFFPDFKFETFSVDAMDQVVVESWPFPCVIKPKIGFFSLGVYRLNRVEDWPALKTQIRTDLTSMADMYPETVLDTATFMMEEWIDGDEFAVDAFFNAEGDPIILNITQHLFSSAEDVGDRVYYTSEEVMMTMLPHAREFLGILKNLGEFRNVPLHFEFRLHPEQGLVPIEVNPLRFGAWCTTADLASFAWDFNPLELYRTGERPNWNDILASRKDRRYCMVLLNNNSGYDKKDVAKFDHEAFLKLFKKPIEYRPIEDPRYSLFGILFTETLEDDLSELNYILHSNLREFIELKQP